MNDATTPETTETERRIDRSTLVKLVIAAFLAVAFVVFAVQNSGSVEVEFLSWSFATRQILLIVVSAAIGIVVWELAGFVRRRGRDRSTR